MNEINKDVVVEALKTVFDPEIALDIWTIGLVYDVTVGGNNVDVTMTLTSPMCPYGPQILEEVEHKVKAIPSVKNVKVNLTFEPAWEPSEELKLQLGLA